ncbi:MAG: ATP-binding protein [Candidatus Brachytrichaceae bacterium NZ_4S206]|jgi:signal transduction histidine kinase
MFNTLHRRFILSHVLPLLVVVPITGLVLIYVLETHVVLPGLANELSEQAGLVAELARDQPGVWSDPGLAQAFVARLSPQLTARLMALDVSGRLLASSDPADAPRLGQPLNHPGLVQARAGQSFVRVAASQSLHTEIVDVLAPVMGRDRRVLGFVRLSYPLTSIYHRLQLVRYLVAGILLAGLLLGVLVGTVLALNLQRPLQQTTQAVRQLADGQLSAVLPEKGPTEIQTLMRAFNVLTARLRLLEEARRRLLANLVHELGRPLGALLSAVQALLAGADRDPALRRELHEEMETQIRGLQRLLDDLARLRGQVLGALELDRQLMAVDTWLTTVLGPWRVAAAQKGLAWHSDIPPGLPPISADPDRLAQVVGNLVSNAIKYTPAPGSVTVSAGADADGVWLRVSDTGPGIPPEEQERIFTPFYRGQSSGRFPQGMGLGLSIARELVVAHGGRLTVESTPGSGSHFTVWLPIYSPI